MAVKITPSGEQLILQQIARLEQELKQVRMDKNIAFNACGDDKLANPNFHKLEHLSYNRHKFRPQLPA